MGTSFSADQLFLGMGPAVKCGWHTMRYSIGERQFSLCQKIRYKLQLTSLLRMGPCVHFSIVVLGPWWI